MKDKNDNTTIDGIPKKRGRPPLNRETGPMTPMERYNRYKEGKVIIQLKVTTETRDKLASICEKNNTSRSDQVTIWIDRLYLNQNRKGEK